MKQYMYMDSDISFMFRYPMVVQVREEWTLKRSLRKTTKEALSCDLPIDMQVKVCRCMSSRIIWKYGHASVKIMKVKLCLVELCWLNHAGRINFAKAKCLYEKYVQH